MTGPNHPDNGSNATAKQVHVEVLGPEKSGGNSNPGPSQAHFAYEEVLKEAPGAKGASNMRLVATLLVAALADSLEFIPPPFGYVGDFVAVVGLLFLWGFRWEILAVLLPELIPGLNVFPTWTGLALYFVFQKSGQGRPSGK
jgi:hypothetical protein